MINENSIITHRVIKPSIRDRRQVVLAVYQMLDRPLIDREVLEHLYGKDCQNMNLVRPRITEMICPNDGNVYSLEEKPLIECQDKRLDPVSGMKVRQCRLRRPEEIKQQELY